MTVTSDCFTNQHSRANAKEQVRSRLNGVSLYFQLLSKLKLSGRPDHFRSRPGQKWGDSGLNVPCDLSTNYSESYVLYRSDLSFITFKGLTTSVA